MYNDAFNKEKKNVKVVVWKDDEWSAFPVFSVVFQSFLHRSYFDVTSFLRTKVK